MSTNSKCYKTSLIDSNPNFLPVPPTSELEKHLATVSLAHFFRQSWPILEPGRELDWNWHHDAIVEHLEATVPKIDEDYNIIGPPDIRRLIINVPPRHTKSLLIGVGFPAWVWIRLPHLRFLFSSYAQELSTRDSVKCRRVIQSPWYQTNWSNNFQITSDQNQKTRFENSRTGYRLATSVLGAVTGEGGDYVASDDPHNIKQAESILRLKEAQRWWDESMSTRLNDPSTGVFLMIMQRSNQSDLTGHVLSKENNYVHLCLPARFEGKTYVSVVNKKPHKLGTLKLRKDPRKEEGDVLWIGRYPKPVLDELEKGMTPYAVAGQQQQRPSPRGGGLFKVENFQLVDEVPNKKIIKTIRYWDKAGTEGGGCNTAGVKMALFFDNTVIVLDCRAGKWGISRRNLFIRNTAKLDGYSVEIHHEQEPGSSGKESAENTTRELSGYIVHADVVSGNKEVRAEPLSIQVNAGNVYLLNRDWTEAFVNEYENFPAGSDKDRVDAGSGAFNKLLRKGKSAGGW